VSPRHRGGGAFAERTAARRDRAGRRGSGMAGRRPAATPFVGAHCSPIVPEP
jgi:hypothetical protein